MVRVSTALAVLLAACWPAAVVCAAPAVLELDDAFARVLDHHPSLRLIDARRDRLEAGQDQAALRPALRLGVDLENVLGSGDYSGVSGAEAGLTLASVLERGGKREARQALAAARVNALGMTRQAQRLDLLAEVARRYLDLADAQARAAIADDAIALRERTLEAARLRHRIGAAPESSALAAEAAVARAMLSRERALSDAQASWRRLELLWGGAGTDEPPATVGTVTALPEVAPVDTLLSLIDRTPALLRFADETRVREARLRLAETRRTPDLDWQIGVRRLQSDGDVALMAGISLPLGSRARAEPQVRSARAELAELSIEHELTGLELRAAVLEAHGRYQGARAEVARIDTALLPLLERTERAADAAFRAGALPWLEWAQVQADIVAAHNERLAAALEGRRALIELQRLTAEPIVLPADREQELQP